MLKLWNILFPVTHVTALGIASTFGSDVGNPPCFMNDDKPPVIQKPMDMASLQPVLKEINDLKLHSESLLKVMEINYCVDGEDGSFLTVPYNPLLDKKAFLGSYINEDPSFLTMIRDHYDMLNRLANYVEVLRGIITEKTAKDSLLLTQDHIYEAMCTIKMFLKSQNQDPQCKVPGGNVSDILYIYGQGTPNRCVEQTFEYVIIHDCKRVAHYLESLYTYILNT
ncbi:uncharacterized protein LOC132741866 [Ruditapes philippinarum]|uniref:uncharacterized protein LOC132741866 n=1 Tax=Ruditapes philippinarum TaxID=129788 RepID=UPI00295BF4CA|nr:uncharacterized protein LOC132741866 [Ruditapes philippinarum]